MYTMDGTQLLWKGKPAKIANPKLGRRVTDTMATDGQTLYFAQKPVPLPPGIDLDQLQARVFNENPFNLFGAILDDGGTVWQLKQRGGLEIIPLPGADFDTIERLKAPGLYLNNHVRDRHHIWYCGTPLEQITADKASLLTENIVSDGEHLWICGKRSARYRHGEITPVCSDGGDDLVRTDDALLRIGGRDGTVAVVVSASGSLPWDQTAQNAVEALGRDLFGVFGTYPQILTAVADMDWDKVRKKAQANPDFDFVARFEGPSLVLEADNTEPIQCAVDGWYGALCTLWLRRRGLPGNVLTYPSLGIMRPDGQEFRQRLITENRDAYLSLCGAAFAQGAQSEARLMLHAYVQTYWHGHDTPFDEQETVVASLPRGLFERIAYAERRYEFRNTTNLAAARHAVNSGLIEDADPRVRLEMLALIHATVLESSKTSLFFRHILPAVLQRQECETVATVREHADATAEVFIIAGLVRAEVYYEQMAAIIEPIVRRQIARGINVVLNRARLIEVLIHQNRESEVQTAIAEFKADFGPKMRLPGLYVGRPLHASVDDAVAAMRQRADELT